MRKGHSADRRESLVPARRRIAADTIAHAKSTVHSQRASRRQLAPRLAENDANLIVGEGVTPRGTMIAAIDGKTVRSVAGISFTVARNIPGVLKARGFEVVSDPTLPRVGAMIVWDEGGADHSGQVR